MLRTTFATFLVSAMISSCTAASNSSSGSISSFVKGKPEGFAAGTTGGGNATPVYPSSIAELKKVLGQSKPAVVVLKKEFNFIGTEGKKTEIGCKVSKCGSKGQDALPNHDWCKSKPSLKVTSDTAGHKGIMVTDSKTLVGVGSTAGLRGKGLMIRGKNIIIQNIAITNINPEYIFGGDALDLDKTDKIWIDRVSISNIGRQFMRAGHNKCGRITISNCNFNGKTAHSGSCNGQQYWGFLFLGAGDQITMMNNNFVSISGRCPKVGGMATANVMVHAVNNNWSNCDGHAFALEVGGQALIEGNSFNNVKQVVLDKPKGKYLLIDDSNTKECLSLGLGRACVPNKFNKCKKPPKSSGKCTKFTSYKPPAAKPAGSSSGTSNYGGYSTTSSKGGGNDGDKGKGKGKPNNGGGKGDGGYD